MSDANVTIKVADQAGGMPRSGLADIWSYRSMHTDRNWKVATDRKVLPVSVGDANWKVCPDCLG